MSQKLRDWLLGSLTTVSLESSHTFNVVAGNLSAKDRKALVENLWAGSGKLVDSATGQAVAVTPDLAASQGELLFYVSFPGAARDRIPTQHYMVGAQDERVAVTRAHELYQRQPKTRKGASLRVMLGRPPASCMP